MKVSVETNREGLYLVKALFRPVMEDMFETITHVARFEAAEDAERLAERVRASVAAAPCYNELEGINTRYWQGPTSLASPVRWDAEVSTFVVAAR